MKALLAQLEPGADPEQNAGRVCGLIDERDCDLAVFPELFLGGYSTAGIAERALSLDSPVLLSIADACRRNKTAAIVGFTEAIDSAAGRYGNSAVCLDTDGSTRAVYRKTHLFGPAEVEAFVQGDKLEVVELGGTATGPLICFDTEFPEPARQLAETGADLLVTVAANMEPYGDDHELASRARALDNRRFHLYVNRVGEEAGLRFVGRSRVIAPDGSTIEELGDEEGLIEVEIEPGAEQASEPVDYLRHLRKNLTVSVEVPNRGEI
ncbi:MAG: carbon-nitrogen hydrolase [Actinomycetota bacterium]|nr:carbon-nitrogen hydrolase [Actinomycetota bacterium]